MRMQLGDVAWVRPGYQFRGRIEPDPAGNVRLIQIKDVDERSGVRAEGLVRVQLGKPGPYWVQDGDVLFLSRGERPFATVVRGLGEDVIATSFFFVLRPDFRLVAPEYLAWLLNQDSFRLAASPYQRGTHMRLISVTDFRRLEIELPPLDVQGQIVRLAGLVERERALAGELARKRAALLEAVSRRAARRVTGPGE